VKPWLQRSVEEQRLLNPAFCSVLLWHAAAGYRRESNDSTSMPFAETLLILPAVLHSETRNLLPRTIATSLSVWVGENTLSRAIIADRSRLLVPFTKEAILFGAVHSVLTFSGGGIVANPQVHQRISSTRFGSDEVAACMKGAGFVGRWFAKTGDAETVMALLGLQP
jgi:ABC-three component (ABC-3C) system Middle Component 3